MLALTTTFALAFILSLGSIIDLSSMLNLFGLAPILGPELLFFFTKAKATKPPLLGEFAYDLGQAGDVPDDLSHDDLGHGMQIRRPRSGRP